MCWLSPFFYMEVVVGPKKKEKRQLTSIEMKFFKRIAGYTLFDRKRNEEILTRNKEDSNRIGCDM
jgi:hypothetical protein